MPRSTRSGSTAVGTGLSLRNNANANNKVNLGGKNENIGAKKRKMEAGENPKNSQGGKPATKRRAALGEITNAFAETSSQVQKSFSKMLSKSKSKSKLTSSTNSSKNSSIEKTSSSVQKDQIDIELPEPEISEPKKAEEKVNDEFEAEEEVIEDEKDLEDEGDDEYESAEEGEPESKFPPGVIDFDAQNSGDVNQCSEYARQIFAYYKSREEMFTVFDYMKAGVQSEVTIQMRAILVDWLVEVQESFELNHETLYTAVKMMDIYLSRTKKVPKARLQLVGAVACLIACKIDERIPPLLDDFVYVCDDAYTKDEIKALEIEMIDAVGYDVGYPLTYRYLRRYARVCGASMNVLTFARYIQESTLMEYALNVETSESLLATAVVYMAFKIKGVTDFEQTLEFYSGHKLAETAALCRHLHTMLLKPTSDAKKTIRTKYSHEVFHEVAKTVIPRTMEFPDEA